MSLLSDVSGGGFKRLAADTGINSIRTFESICSNFCFKYDEITTSPSTSLIVMGINNSLRYKLAFALNESASD